MRLESKDPALEAHHVDHASPHPVGLPARDGIPAAELLEEVLAEFAVTFWRFLTSQDATPMKLLDLRSRSRSY